MKKNILIICITVTIILIIIGMGILAYNFISLNEKKPIEANSNIQEVNNQTNTSEPENNEEISNNNQALTQIDENIINEEPTTRPTTTASYYYNQLDEYGKIIYNKLKQNKNELKTGKYVFDFGTTFNTLLHSENGEEKLNTAFQSAWNGFSYDQNDLFYVDINKMSLIKENRTLGGITTYYVSIGPGNNTDYLEENFKTQEEVQKAQQYIENIIRQIKEQTKENTDVQKIKKVHDWLVSVIEYDKTEENLNKYSIYGALHDKKAVCEGYARSFKYIMEEIGVPCVLVAGTAQNSEGTTEVHAWNYVQIEQNWYAIDITWDDPIVIGNAQLTEQQRYKYFLKGSEEFFKNHTENGVLSENSMKFTFPTLAKNNYNM